MSGIKALTAVTETGELESIDMVRAHRLAVIEAGDVEGARNGEAYCSAAAQLMSKLEGMEAGARQWQREAVEYAIAIGRLTPREERGRGKITPSGVLFPQQERSKYRQLYETPEDVREAYFEEAEAKGMPPTKSGLRSAALKAVRAAEIEKQLAGIESGEITLPVGIFDVIDIDPPWPYAEDIARSGYDPAGHRASNPYPEMSLAQIEALPVAEHAAENCVLWLWTTHRFMRHSFSLLDAWGFQERAIVTWRKDRMGLGRWLRSQTEFCIMATRGKPTITLTNQTTIIDGPMREHSRKPDEFYAMVETLCPAVRRLVWFGREPRDGWQVGGNEPGKFDDME